MWESCKKVMRVFLEKMRFVTSGTRFLISRYGGGKVGAKRAFSEAVSVLIKRGPRQVFRQIINNINASRYAGKDIPQAHTEERGKERFHSQKIVPHQKMVEVIVCVHNALDDVKRCLSSVVRYSLPPYKIILVDDGSQAETTEYLELFSRSQGALLLRNNEAKGYTLAANQGLGASHGDFVVLLNSDTVVSEGWLDRMIQCAISFDKIGMVGPLSNTASWQSIPEILVDGDWASNPLPDGVTIPEMAALVAKNSKRIYPRLSFLNGFCIMIKRELMEDIGIFDEETFGQGFCEENDYCLRARLKGWELAVADDVYIYHAQSKSYTNERRLKLAAESDRKFVEKFNQQLISTGVDQCRYDYSMLGIRGHARQLYELAQISKEGLKRWEGKSLAIILPVMYPSGGANIVITEVKAMQEMGVRVTIVNTSSNRVCFEKSYNLDSLDCVYVDDPKEAEAVLQEYDVAIATTFGSVSWLTCFSDKKDAPKLGYYIQDFEPNFFDENQDKTLFLEARNSYSLIPQINRFTKTCWNQKKLQEQLDLESYCVGVSYNQDVFRPTPKVETGKSDCPVKIVAMIRPETPRRSAELTLKILCNCGQKYRHKVELITFGCDDDNSIWRSVPDDININNLGIISSIEVGSLFNEADIFVDFSSFQAMGLSALEAMASGVAVIVPEEGGAKEYARHDHNSLLVDSRNETACQNALERLVDDRGVRVKIQRQAIIDVARLSPIRCAYRILTCLFSDGQL